MNKIYCVIRNKNSGLLQVASELAKRGAKKSSNRLMTASLLSAALLADVSLASTLDLPTVGTTSRTIQDLSNAGITKIDFGTSTSGDNSRRLTITGGGTFNYILSGAPRRQINSYLKDRHHSLILNGVYDFNTTTTSESNFSSVIQIDLNSQANIRALNALPVGADVYLASNAKLNLFNNLNINYIFDNYHNSASQSFNSTGAEVNIGDNTLTLNGEAKVVASTPAQTRYGGRIHSTINGKLVITGGTHFIRAHQPTHLGETIIKNSATARYLSDVSSVHFSGNYKLEDSSRLQLFTYHSSLVNIDNKVNGSGSVTMQANGSDRANLLLRSKFSHTGATTLAHASLKLNDHNLLSENSVFRLEELSPSVSSTSFSILDLDNKNQTIGGLASTLWANNGSYVQMNSAVLTINDNTADGVYVYDIKGTGSIIKTGDKALTLAGNIEQGITTTINGGTFQIGYTTPNPTVSTQWLNGTTGSVAGNIVNNGTLKFARSNAYDYTSVISGSGNVVVDNGGIITLDKNQTFTGNTTIESGELRLGNGGATGGVVGNIINNGKLTLNRSDDLVFNNLISGTGALEKQGTNTVTLTADNTHTGVTTVSAGTLQIGNGGTTGSLVGNIDNNANVIFNRSGDISYGGVISGTGDTEKLGTGTLTLTGDSTNTGKLTVSAGFLNVGDGGTSGSLASNIVSANKVTFNRSDESTYSGSLSGAGAIEKQGTGTLVLTGSNTNTGGTTISAGTLQLGNGGTTGSVVGDIVNNGTLAFNHSNDLTLGMLVSGTGALEKLGSNTLTLTADHTNTGTTTISDGVLQLGNGGTTGSVAGNIVNNGLLAFNRSDDLTLNTLISGTGDIHKLGANTLTLTGNNTNTGLLIVGDGLLQGSNSGTLQIGDGGTTGSVEGNIDNKANVIFNRSDDMTYGGAMSGEGDTEKLGAGTLVLTGDSTNTGTFTVTEGALQVGNGGKTGSLTSNIDNATQVIFNRSDDITYGGSISGVGSIEKLGAGTLVLTGTNENTGGTTINGGALQLGNGGTTGSVVGDIVNNGSLIVNRSDDVLFDNAISGTGTLEKLGSNTLTLTADNTNTGTTTITAGVLQLGNGGTTGSVAGQIVNNGSLIINRSDNFSLSNVVSGSGTINMVGSGGLVITSDSTNNVTINSGTLQLGNGGTTGSVAGDIVNNGNLVFNRGDAYTYSGVVSGAGTIETIGAGTITLTSNNTNTGATTISAGTLQLGNGGTTGSVVGDIINNGTLVINRSDNLTLGNLVRGNGALIKLGQNVLVINRSDTDVSNTEVRQGSLIIGSSTNDSRAALNSDIEVFNGGLLGGHGRVTGNVIFYSGGTLSTGNSIGTLAVQGNVDLKTGSMMNVDINLNTAEHDRFIVAGDVTLGDTALHLDIKGNVWDPAAEYKILTANTVTGSFSTLTSNLIFLEPQQLVNPQDITIKLVRNNVGLDTLAKTPNQKEVAQSLDSNPSSNLAGNIVMLDDKELITEAFEQMSGELHASIRSSIFDESRNIRDAITNRLYATQSGITLGGLMHSSESRQHGLWVKYYDSDKKYKENLNNARTTNSGTGIMFGIDKLTEQHWRFGMTLSRSENTFKIDKHFAEADVDSTAIGLYLGRDFETVNLRAGAVYSKNEVDSSRHVTYGAAKEHLTARYNANSMQAFAEVGHSLVFSKAKLEPFAGLAIVKVDEDKVNERGGLAGLSSHKGKDDISMGTVGVRGASTLANINGMSLDLQASVAWQHTIGSEIPRSTFSFADHDAFNIHATPLNKDSTLIQTGLDLKITQRASLGLTYSGVLGNTNNAHAVQVGLNVVF